MVFTSLIIMLSRSASTNRFKLRSMLKNKEDIEFSNIKQLINWNIPKVSSEKIYGMGMFKLFSSMSVKTIEQLFQLKILMILFNC